MLCEINAGQKVSPQSMSRHSKLYLYRIGLILLLFVMIVAACSSDKHPGTRETLLISGSETFVSNETYYGLIEVHIEGVLTSGMTSVDAYYVIDDVPVPVDETGILELDDNTAISPNSGGSQSFGAFSPDFEEDHSYAFNWHVGYENRHMQLNLKRPYWDYEGQLRVTIIDISEGNPR